MSNISRRHHYRSEFYLRAFTPSGAKGDQLTAIDLGDARVFSTSPENVGVKRDFNRIDKDGVAPDALETEFSKVEGVMADALVQLDKGESFDGAIKNALLNLVALFAVRSPSWREYWANLKVMFARQKLREALASRDTWATHVQRASKYGIELSIDDFDALHLADQRQDFNCRGYAPGGTSGISAHSRRWRLARQPVVFKSVSDLNDTRWMVVKPPSNYLLDI